MHNHLVQSWYVKGEKARIWYTLGTVAPAQARKMLITNNLIWCWRGESNPQGDKPRQILSLLRLPVPPLQHGRDLSPDPSILARSAAQRQPARAGWQRCAAGGVKRMDIYALLDGLARRECVIEPMLRDSRCSVPDWR